VRTSEVIDYRPGFTFDVTAGIGAFDGSLVPPWIALSNGTITPVMIEYETELLADAGYTINVEPVTCAAADPSCSSYLLPGGLSYITPWPPSSYEEYPVIEIFDAPALQVEIRDHISEPFSLTDCSFFGDIEYLIAVEVCVAQSVVYHGSIIAR
jgi:hypothetical protein